MDVYLLAWNRPSSLGHVSRAASLALVPGTFGTSLGNFSLWNDGSCYLVPIL